MTMMHKISEYKLECDLCCKNFKFEHTFLAHCEKHFPSNKGGIKFLEEIQQTRDLVQTRTRIKQKYDCNVCEKSFFSQIELNAHICAHSREKPHVCGICHEEFACDTTFQSHCKTHKTYSSDKKEVLKNKKYGCSVCEMIFSSEDLLQVHSRVVHLGSEKKPYVCNICCMDFANNKEYRIHYEIHKSNSLDQQKTLKKQKFQCRVCKINFASEVLLEAHFCAIPLRSKDILPYVCKICCMEFTCNSEYYIHCKIHNSDKEKVLKGYQYQCNVCEKTFSSKVVLDVHFRTHTGNKPYVCKMCREEFACIKEYGRHVKSHKKSDFALKLNLYHCTLCQEVFKREIDFRDHENSHSGATPYKCGSCDVKFSEFKLLQKHACTKNNSTCFCMLCSKKFTNKSTLKRHIDSKHLEYQKVECKICLKKFTRNCSLKKHMRSHTGEKPYVCDVCQKPFSLNYNLRVHYRIHTGEKPFQCEICKKSFRVKLILDDHYKTHRSK